MFRKLLFVCGLSVLTLFANALELKEEALRSVFEPSFVTTEGEQKAGTAFVVKYKENYYAVTAHHLFSEAGGFSREYNWRELQGLVSKVSLQSLSDEKIKYSAGKAIEIKGAKSVSIWTGKNDIAVFKLKQKPDNYLTIAQLPPKVGESVWLYGLVYNRPPELLLHKAMILEYGKNWISYQFEDPGLNLNGTSGAAILNSKGEVVGINLSGGDQEGKLYGYGNPLVSIQSIFKQFVQ
ncbi:S1 family peptidase [Gynuella sp.]|uniref:S1 family peptidase n=1 Tax=Gynuella sp. TaxID=2969146 RepID=UPI003D11351B